MPSISKAAPTCAWDSFRKRARRWNRRWPSAAKPDWTSAKPLTLFDLAKLDRQTGAPAEAASHAAAALDLVESLRARFGSRQERIESASSHRKYYDLAIQLAMDAGDSARAFALSERARTRGLVDLLAEAGVKISRGIDPALLARRGETEELLNAKYDRFLQLLDSPHTAAREAAARQEIDGLLDGYTQTDAQIRAASPEYAALTQPQPPSLAQTQALLPPQGTALVEFWLGEARSFAWVVEERLPRFPASGARRSGGCRAPRVRRFPGRRRPAALRRVRCRAVEQAARARPGGRRLSAPVVAGGRWRARVRAFRWLAHRALRGASGGQP